MVRTLAIALAAAAAITAGSVSSASAHGAHMGHMGMGHMGMGHPHFGHGFAFRHRFFHGPFFAFGPYGYDECRVWTPYGWRWSYACYDY